MPILYPALSALILPLAMSPAAAVDDMEPPILNLSMLASRVSIALPDIAAVAPPPIRIELDTAFSPPSAPCFPLSFDAAPAFAPGNMLTNGLSL